MRRPVDRPNLSKDYLAGNAPEDWVPLRPESYYAENGIELRLKASVAGDRRTGARGRAGRREQSPLRPAAARDRRRAGPSRHPGRRAAACATLRSLADCRAIIARAATARQVVVMGASFIGLEVAAALRARKIEVHVVAPDKRPMERILGPQMGDFVRCASRRARRGLPPRGHGERHRRKAGQAEERQDAEADSWSPASACARGRNSPRKPGIALDRGVLVDAYLEDERARHFRGGRHRALARSP